MNQDELKELIYFLSQKDISEFSIERADSTVRIKRNIEVQTREAAPSLASAPRNSAPAGAVAGVIVEHNGTPSSIVVAAEAEDEQLHILKSPMVGIFQRGPAAGGRPFVAEGDRVEIGQVVGMIEVLRLMHEVHSEVTGEIVEITASDREPVEYGQPLLAIRPSNKPN